MTLPIRLERWAVVDSQPFDVFRAPECAVPCLRGEVFGHPRHPNGTRVTTSPIVGRDGDRVVTASGSVYELGEMEPGYAGFIKEDKAAVLNRIGGGR